MKLILAIFALSIASLASAQVEGQEKMIEQRIAEKIACLYDYISFMANKNEPIKRRMRYKDRALNMFIGKGYCHEENGVYKEGALIHIKTRNGRIHSILVMDYFQRLVIGMRTHSDVKIEAAEKYAVEEEIGDGLGFYFLLGDLYAIENG